LLRLCIALSLLDIVLIGAFHLAFGNPGLDDIVWNLFLAWIPLVAALALDDIRSSPLALNVPLLAFWLAFFPNAPYLVTDLVHANDYGHGAAGAIATLALIAAVPAGLALGFSSLLLVERSMRDRFGPRVALAISVASLAAACVGIYVGRVLRLNTWDIVARPRFVAALLHQHLLDPRPLALAATVALGMLLTALYLRFRRTVAPASEKL
jgi:uncharacterized membrane protein